MCVCVYNIYVCVFVCVLFTFSRLFCWHLAPHPLSSACSAWGFFQLVQHPVDPKLREEFLRETRRFFELPYAAKDTIRRRKDNARGFFDDELTKQKVDWKQGFDFGQVPFPDLPDEHADNTCQDGFNLWPEDQPLLKSVMKEYFDSLTSVSLKLNEAMAVGLGLDKDYFLPYFDKHTSFLRLNYYPPCPEPENNLGISPHHDAGWLTILYADEDVKSLQVVRNNEWITLEPERGSYIINTGDMAAVLLRIVEIIGQDSLKNIDEDTLYFIISALNQLNVDPLRNRILFKVLPLKV